jgi:sec-independent protein translocase protein TatA
MPYALSHSKCVKSSVSILVGGIPIFCYLCYYTNILNLYSMLNSVLIGIFGLGGSEMIVVLIIVLLLFGGKKIPELMKGLGKGVKEFKDASKGVDENNTITEKKD